MCNKDILNLYLAHDKKLKHFMDLNVRRAEEDVCGREKNQEGIARRD